MGKFSLENRIKDRLKGHEIHIDKRELWKSLGIEEEEKDRKAIWFWWFAGLVGIVFTAGLWWLGQKDDLGIQSNAEIDIIEVDEHLAKTGNETMAETSTIESLSSIIEEVKSQDDNAEKISNSSKSNPTKNGTTEVNESFTADTKKESSRSSEAIENGIVDSKINSEFKIKSTSSGIEKSGNGKNILSELLMIEKLPQAESYLTYVREIDDLEAEVNPLIKPIAKSMKFEFELYGGMGSIARELSTTDRDYEGYVAGRDSSESTLEQFSFGVSLKYFLGGGFYGKAGLGINRWNEKYSYNATSDTVSTIIDIPEIILIDLQGNSTTTKFVQGVETSYTLIDWTRYNRLTQIDLPISLGYEARVHRWSVFGEATAIINIKQLFKGYLYTPDGDLAKDPKLFKSNIGLNLGLNAGVGYGITPRLRARLSARYYRSLGSVFIADHDVNQKYSSLGLRAGIGYLF